MGKTESKAMPQYWVVGVLISDDDSDFSEQTEIFI